VERSAVRARRFQHSVLQVLLRRSGTHTEIFPAFDLGRELSRAIWR
jgi:hypothetical protein